jgi:hypothetical protein
MSKQVLRRQDMTVSNSNEPSDKIDYLFKTIGRYDLYLNSTNSKASLILAWNGFVLSFILVKYDAILANYARGRWSIVLAIMFLTLIGISTLFSSVQSFRVVFPYVKGETENPSVEDTARKSMMFFGSVATMSPAELHSRISASTAEERLLDIAQQAVILARGTRKKMQLARSSIAGIGCELLFLLALMLLKVVVW